MDVVVTGAYRSGTTLLDRLLHEHPAASVVPQPMPYLWIAAKRRFLASIGHDDPYPFGHLFLEDRYRPEELASFLDAQLLTDGDVAGLIDSMRSYSGVMTPEVFDVASDLQGGTLLEIHHQAVSLLAERLGRHGARVVGSKEILLEELAPWLSGCGVAVIVVLRDPRGMLASLVGGDQWTGRLRPTLLALRTWRKSAAYALALAGDPSVAVVRYEDLLGPGAVVPPRVWSTLGLESPTSSAAAPEGWDGNTSYATPPASAAQAAERAAEVLGSEVAAYVEAVCWPELRALGYPVRSDAPDRASLATFEEIWSIDHGAVPADYSMQPIEREHELERLDVLSAGTDDPDERRRWFIDAAAYVELRAALLDHPPADRGA